MAAYVSDPAVTNFQPMNANFGLVPPLGRKVKGGKRARGEAMGERALGYVKEAAEKLGKTPSPVPETHISGEEEQE